MTEVMIMPSFDERIRHVTLKLQRANQHSDELDRQMRAFLATQPYTVAVRRDQNTRRPIYYVDSVQPVPDAIPLTAGDAIQNLMSALDHLAYQLVCKDTADNPPQPSRIYFPIANDRATYDGRKQGKMEGATAATIAEIDALQPYGGGDDTLWSLHRLNNIEKHRLLLTVGAQAAGIHLGQLLFPHIAGDFDPEIATRMTEGLNHFLMPADKGFPLQPGFELYRDAPDQKINPKLQFRFMVVLNEPGIAEGKPVLETVRDLTTRVEDVVQALSPLLK
jgi:hypothetical protein